MKADKILEVIDLYRQKFMSLNIAEAPYPHLKLLPMFFRRRGALAHSRQMLDQMESFIAEDRLDKAIRWLGFIQGILWVLRVYSLEELKNHSRPAS